MAPAPAAPARSSRPSSTRSPTCVARYRWRARAIPIPATASSSSASATPPSSTTSTPPGAMWWRAWRTSTRSSAASRCAIPTRSSRRPWRPTPRTSLDKRILCRPRPVEGRRRYARLWRHHGDEAMRTDLFDFDLPAERIALRPAVPRDAARLLVVRPDGALEDRGVRDLPDLLNPGDAVVVNDTRVIPARLTGRRIGRDTEPKIEATLTERLDGSRGHAFVRPAKKLGAGDVVRFGEEGKVCFLGQLDATVEDKGEGGEVTLAFAFHGAVLDEAIEERGAMPLPPYIASRRPPDEQDRADYQTMFANAEGSVAAPTAGLHFTDALVERLKARGIALHTVTLHVGAGTFLPVKADDT